jgi:hypothetical protein
MAAGDREDQVMSQPPSSYDFVPLPDRAPLKFPGGAHVALIFTINIEYWEPFRPGQKAPLFPGGPATIPHALPGDVLDTANWTWREYGQRIGIWRLMDVFDAIGVAPSCTCNGMILTERRRIIDAVKERGWELVPHNWAQNDLLTDYRTTPRRSAPSSAARSTHTSASSASRQRPGCPRRSAALSTRRHSSRSSV